MLIGWFLSLVYHRWIVQMSVICHTIRQSFMCVCDVPTLSAIITIWNTGPNLIAMCTTILHTILLCFSWWCISYLLITRKEKELVATVRKAAEAEGYKLEKLAEGQRSVTNCSVASLFYNLKMRKEWLDDFKKSYTKRDLNLAFCHQWNDEF